MSVAVSDDADARLRRWIVEMIAGGDVAGYRGQAHAAFAFDLRGRLKEITVPATVLHGSNDRTIPVQAAGITAAGIAGAELVILEGLGHFGCLENPAVFDPALARALGLPETAVPRL